MRNPSSESEALAYITDCTLATVCHMALKKTRPKGEYTRQIGIAQKALEMMVRFGTNMSDTRAAEVMKDFSGNVTTWAQSFESK